jgi:hypothetical protein
LSSKRPHAEVQGKKDEAVSKKPTISTKRPYEEAQSKEAASSKKPINATLTRPEPNMTKTSPQSASVPFKPTGKEDVLSALLPIYQPVWREGAVVKPKFKMPIKMPIKWPRPPNSSFPGTSAAPQPRDAVINLTSDTEGPPPAAIDASDTDKGETSDEEFHRRSTDLERQRQQLREMERDFREIERRQRSKGDKGKK